MTWTPTPPATIPDQAAILDLLTRQGTDPPTGPYITPDDLAAAWQAFMSGDYWRTPPDRVVNGAFGIWQRGGGPFTTHGSYSADRWRILNNGASTQSVTRVQDSAESPTPYYVRDNVAGGAAAADAARIATYLEDVRTYNGETITVSFEARSQSGARDLAVSLEQYFGIGGAPSASVNTPAGKVSLDASTTWQAFALTVAVPSIAGKGIGTTDNGALTLQFWFSAGTSSSVPASGLGPQSGTFDVRRVQIDRGAVASGFQYRPPVVELPRCQRYTRALPGTAAPSPMFATGQCIGATQATLLVPHPVPMRKAPLLSIYSGVVGDFAIWNNVATGQACTGLAIQAADVDRTYLFATVAGGLVAGNAAMLVRNANAPTLILDAEY